MTIYQVRDLLGGDVILEMEASSVNEVPTSVTGDKGLLLDWANDMVASGQSVYLIGTGCGPNASLGTKDGRQVPQSLNRAFFVAKSPTGESPAVSSTDAWVTVYDVGAGVCTVTATGQNRNWAELRRDDAISDPEDRFVVYVGEHQDVQVRFRLDEFGWPIALHPDFDQTLIGSPTIWPERLRQFVWWSSERKLWRGDRPTKWETRYPSSHDPIDARPGPPPPAPYSPPAPKKRVPRGRPGLRNR